MINKYKYINAYEELGRMIDTHSKNYERFSKLCKVCEEGQQLGIKELQKPE